MSEPSAPLRFLAGSALVAGLALGGAAVANAQSETTVDPSPTTAPDDSASTAPEATTPEADGPEADGNDGDATDDPRPDCGGRGGHEGREASSNDGSTNTEGVSL